MSVRLQPGKYKNTVGPCCCPSQTQSGTVDVSECCCDGVVRRAWPRNTALSLCPLRRFGEIEGLIIAVREEAGASKTPATFLSCARAPGRASSHHVTAFVTLRCPVAPSCTKKPNEVSSAMSGLTRSGLWFHRPQFM